MDLKGDLVFEDLVFYQCEGSVGIGGLRGHEVSDKDTKETLWTMLTFKFHIEWRDVCVQVFLPGLLDVVEDTWDEVPLIPGPLE